MSTHRKSAAVLFRPGDRVQVWDRCQWKDAVILRLASYGGGYDFQFDPLPAIGADGYRASTGGWTCDSFCRPRVS